LFRAASRLAAGAPAAAPLEVTHPGAAQSGSGGAAGSAAPPTPPTPPHAVDQEATTAEDAPVNIYWLTYNDTSPSLATISVVGVTQGSHGSAALQPDGTVTYTPGLHWSGTDTFTYTISDGAGTATANVAVTVTHVNYPAVASPVNASTNQNSPVTVTLSSTEVDPGPVSYVIAQGPGQGTLGPVSDNQVTYYPGGNFSGTDSFTYQADNGNGLSVPATVTVTVNPVVQGPGVTVTPNGGAVRVDEAGLAPVSGTYTLVLNTQPSAPVTVAASADATQLLVTPASLTFTPDNWSVPQTVTAQAVDDQIDRGDHTVPISHSAVSADPAYNNITISNLQVAVTSAHDAGILVDPSTDTQGDLDERGPTSDSYTVQLTSKPTANVTVALTPDSQVTVSPASLTFTPGNWDTPQTVTLTLNPESAADGYHPTQVALTASSPDATYQGKINTISQNIIDRDGPSALPDAVTTLENVAGTFNVLANDVSPQGYSLSVTGVTQPSNGSAAVNPDNSVTYTPRGLWWGTDSFRYTLSDGHGGSDQATVTVTVGAVNQPPVVVNPGSQTSAEDDKVSLQIVATKPDESGFKYTATGLPPGLVMEAKSGVIWGWVAPTAAGTYTPSVTVDDFNGGVTTVNFTWTVTHTNHAPSLDPPANRLMFINSYVVTPQDAGPHATDIDGDNLTYGMTGLPPGLTYDPAQNKVQGMATAAGIYHVTESADDGHGGTDTRDFVWEVSQPFASRPGARLQQGVHPTNNFALVNPATPVALSVSLDNLGDPTTPVPVTLVVTPAGRATIDTPVVTLRDGESATVHLYPLAVSQQVDDVQVVAYAGGVATDKMFFTNLGVVLPGHVRAPDTPQGTKDRISLGTGEWGSFNAPVQVTPNLAGRYAVSAAVQRPAEDDKYGNAAVDTTDVARLSLATHAVVKVIGTVLTAPSVGPDGQPDGLAANADKLRLAVVVGAVQLVMAHAFAAAPIPTATKFSVFQAIQADNSNKWKWGVEEKVDFVSDGGSLRGAYYSEDFKRVSVSRDLEKSTQATTNGIWQQLGLAGVEVHDRQTLGYPSSWTRAKALAAIKRLAQLLVTEHRIAAVESHQLYRYYVSAVERRPAEYGDAKVVEKSGYQVTKQLHGYSDKDYIRIGRYPEAGRGAEKGLVDAEYSKANYAHYVELK
jgi:hypothetical protein